MRDSTHIESATRVTTVCDGVAKGQLALPRALRKVAVSLASAPWLPKRKRRVSSAIPSSATPKHQKASPELLPDMRSISKLSQVCNEVNTVSHRSAFLV